MINKGDLLSMQVIGLNHDSSRIHNRSLVLKLIKKHPGITRADLAVQVGLTKPAISKIVNVYLEKGIIQEDKEETKRNKGLLFSEGFFYGLVIRIGRISLTGSLIDISGNVIVREDLPNGIAYHANDNINMDVRKLIELIVNKAAVDKDKILAIAIAVPGAVSSSQGIIYNRSMAPGHEKSDIPFSREKIHLAEYLEQHIGLPVYLENNSNLSALAEGWFGKGQSCRNFVEYSIGIGTGAGAIINGQLFTGHDGISFEIGHTTVNMDGDLCFCGNKGCLNLVAKFSNIVKEYDGTADVQDDKELLDRLTNIFHLAQDGEYKAIEVIRNHAHKVAVGAVIIINMFSPDKIIISTNEINGLPVQIMLRDIESYIRRHAYPVIAETVEVEMSELGEDIELDGAYALILEKLYYLITDKIKGGI